MKNKFRVGKILSFIIFLLISVAATSPPDTGGNSGGGNAGNTPPAVIDSVYNPKDPSVPATIGFFGDAWTPKTFVAPETQNGIVPTGNVTDSLTIDINKVLVKTPPYIYGNNSNLWMGQVVTEPNLVKYITDLSPNIIRGPAGILFSKIFWRPDGV